MGDLESVARRYEKELGVEFYDTTVAEHPCLAADISDHYAMSARVASLAVEAERSGHLLFVGLDGDEGHHRVFLVSELSSLDIVQLFKVGTHNNSDEACRDVHEVLEKIHRAAPFSVNFADAAGYKARFIDKPDKPMAKTFERLILKVDPQAMDLSDDPVWQRIHEEGILQLWWD